MKKFILISSLLAAGTLAASAATTIVVDSTLFSALTTNPASDSSLLGTSNQWASSYASTDTAIFDSACTDYSAVKNQLFNKTEGCWFYDTATGTYPSDANNAPAVSVNSDGVATIISRQGNRTQSVVAGWGTISLTSLQGITTLGLTYNSITDAVATNPITIAIFSYSSAGEVTRLALQTVDTTGTATIDLSANLNLGEEATEDLKIGVAVRSATTSWAAATLSNVQFIGTAIPEPSFFGLLAGTLALGLAGTRRRRAGTQK